ncbi:MAG: STAS domain-containing protein [Phycisphaerales bacterium JB038]
MSEVRLDGDLRREAELRRQVKLLRSLMKPGHSVGSGEDGVIRIDLTGLTHMNTTLLAALLALGGEAMRSGVHLTITGVPDFFRQYVAMTGVEEALRRAYRYEPGPASSTV